MEYWQNHLPLTWPKEPRFQNPNKKIPREYAVLAGCYEPGSTRWGPCLHFRRFGSTDATHRAKEGSPFYQCWLKNLLPITNTAGVYKKQYSNKL